MRGGHELFVLQIEFFKELFSRTQTGEFELDIPIRSQSGEQDEITREIDDPDGFKGLAEMDALSHVKDGVRYPAVMLTTGVNDPRVAPWEPGKFTARLQAATSSGKPVILRVEMDAGHGIGSTRKQRDDETADTYAFILWQTGDPRFQPKA